MRGESASPRWTLSGHPSPHPRQCNGAFFFVVLGVVLVNDISIALRKLGEMLQASPRAEGELLRGTKSEPRERTTPTLADLGLTKKESYLAQSIKVEALRKLGEMLQASPRAQGVRTVGGGGFSGGTISEPPEDDVPTLAALGLTKKESALAQKLAALSDADFRWLSLTA